MEALQEKLELQEEIFERALDKWGHVAQMLKAVEEAAELIQATMHFIGGKVTPDHVADEVADIIITAGQMRIMFGKENVDQIVQKKMDRLVSLLEEK